MISEILLFIKNNTNLQLKLPDKQQSWAIGHAKAFVDGCGWNPDMKLCQDCLRTGTESLLFAFHLCNSALFTMLVYDLLIVTVLILFDILIVTVLIVYARHPLKYPYWAVVHRHGYNLMLCLYYSH